MAAQQDTISSVKLVELRDLVALVVEEAHAGLLALADQLPRQANEDRKRALLLHLHATRQRLQRLHVVTSWSNKARAVKECSLILQESAAHDAALAHAADQLFHLHGELAFMAAPAYDVGTALHVMQTGGYSLLPSTVEESLALPPPPRSEGVRRSALARMDRLIRSKLLAERLPPGLRVLRVAGGEARVAAAGGQYAARLSLTPAPTDDVVQAKYRPPTEDSEEQLAQAQRLVKEEGEVTQQQEPQQQQHVRMAGAKPEPNGSEQQQQQQQQVDIKQQQVDIKQEQVNIKQEHVVATQAAEVGPCTPQPARGGEAATWRWQLMSLELLPALEAGREPRLVPQPHTAWLRQHTQERMMVAADVQQLQRLGKQHWVAMPPGTGGGGAKAKGRPAGMPSTPSISGQPSASGAAPSVAASDQARAAQEQLQGGEAAPAGGGGGGADVGAQALPAWATSPLLLMHLALEQAAARVALYNLLLPQARDLAAGAWPAGVRVDRSEGGGGIRLSYWHKAAWLTHADLEALRTGARSAGAAAATVPPATASATSPAIDLLLQEESTVLCCVASPPHRHPLTGAEVALPVDLSRSTCSTEQLLLAAASNAAATLLAGVQAVLQRDGQLATVGASAELVLPHSGASSKACGSGAQPPAPQLQVWWRGTAQLGVSVQLRSARLLLTPGPVLLDARGDAGGAGASAAAELALVDAAQQQLDRLQHEVFSLPLPPGSTRGMLAASLAGAAVADLLQRLAMRQRLDAVAAHARTAGLRPSALPPALLSAHRRAAAAPGAIPPLGDHGLLLSLPPFPAPRDMPTLARLRALEGSVGGGDSSWRDSGAVSCHLLINLSPTSGGGGAGRSGSTDDGTAEPAALGQRQQQQGSERQQRQQHQQQRTQRGDVCSPGAQLAFVVCAATARGAVTRVEHVVDVPADVRRATLERQQQEQQQANANAAPRKRGREEPTAAEDGEQRPGRAQTQDVQAAAGSPRAASCGGGGLDLATAVQWCRQRAAWEQLRVQLRLLHLPFREELVLGSDASASVAGHSIRLPSLAGLQRLDQWKPAASRAPAGIGGSSGIGGAVFLRLGHDSQGGAGCRNGGALPAGEVAEGAWRMEVHSGYLLRLRAACEAEGVALALGGRAGQLGGLGICYKYSLEQGHSALTAMAELFSLLSLHLHFTRIYDLIQASTLYRARRQQQQRRSSSSHAWAGPDSCTANGWLHPSAGNVGGGAGGGPQAPALVWEVPGCGEVTVEEVGLVHLVLSVGSPPPQPDELLVGNSAPPLRVTVRWANKCEPDAAVAVDQASVRSSGTICMPAQPMLGAAASGSTGTAAAVAMNLSPRPLSAAGSGIGGVGSGSAGGGGSTGVVQRCVQCIVAAEPELPQTVADALAAQLERGAVQDFLDALCVASHAASITGQALSAAAQCAAGLLPGALTPVAPPAAARAGGKPAPPSPYRLSFRLQQLGRVLSLHLRFEKAGYVLLHLTSPLQRGAPPGTTIPWLTGLAERLQALQGACPAEAAQPNAGVKRAHLQQHVIWCHWEGLPAALAAVMQGLAGTA